MLSRRRLGRLFFNPIPALFSLVLIFLARHVANTHASPIEARQAVTTAISPSLIQPLPAGCTGSFPSVFGIAVLNVSLPAAKSIQPSPSSLQRRQQQPSSSILMYTVGMVDQIVDGQVQGGMHTATASILISTPSPPPTTECTSTSTSVSTLPALSQIGDGQIQGPLDTTAMSVSPFPQLSTIPVPTNAVSVSKPPTVIEQACGISVRLEPSGSVVPSLSPFTTESAGADTQDSAPTVATAANATFTSASSFSSSSSAAPGSPPPRLSLVSCVTNSTLRLQLANNTLSDALNRTGYIASNYQFQFDGPPQAGAIYTAGWSVCPVTSLVTPGQPGQTQGGGGKSSGDAGIMTLALGSQTTFWQCLSGDFYNLYTENWAAQCSPVELRVVRLEEC